MGLYYSSVGHNSTLLLNVPVNRKGLVPKKFENTLRKFGELKKEAFANKIAEARELQTEAEITLNFPKTRITKVVLGEDLKFSQRVESFTLSADGKELARGTTIGYKEIVLLDTITDNLTLRVTKCRREPHLKIFEIYG